MNMMIMTAYIIYDGLHLKLVYRYSNNHINISFKDIPSNIINLNFINFSLSDVFKDLNTFKPKITVGLDEIRSDILRSDSSCAR